MRRLLIACLTVAFTLGTLASGHVAEAKSSCRDAKGKFVKCATVKPAKCRDAKGKFTACPA
ncbi:hypothetical protein [Lichenicoccus sp.]|uniref:hypothetical protein n=1 Tax=Lichenicoccus sp. TaxID=2781899 RepID=UPI003D0BF700